MNRFKEGRDTNKNDKRKGRPVTVSNERKVAEIQEYILENRRVTFDFFGWLFWGLTTL